MKIWQHKKIFFLYLVLSIQTFTAERFRPVALFSDVILTRNSSSVTQSASIWKQQRITMTTTCCNQVIFIVLSMYSTMPCNAIYTILWSLFLRTFPHVISILGAQLNNVKAGQWGTQQFCRKFLEYSNDINWNSVSHLKPVAGQGFPRGCANPGGRGGGADRPFVLENCMKMK